MNDKVRGFTIGVLAAAAYGMNPLFTLPLYKAGLDSWSVLFIRYILAVGMLGIIMPFAKIPFRISFREAFFVIIAGLLFAASSLTLFQSYLFIDAGIASTILFVYPVMVAVIMAVFFGEKATAGTIGGIALALCGVFLLDNGSLEKSMSMKGLILVLISALTYAVYIVIVKCKPYEKIHSVTLVFYALLTGALVYGGYLAWFGKFKFPDGIFSWSNALLLALLPTVISLFGTTYAIRKIGSTPAAILGALEPVTAVFFGVIVFGSVLTVKLIIGMAAIILAVLIIVCGKRS